MSVTAAGISRVRTLVLASLMVAACAACATPAIAPTGVPTAVGPAPASPAAPAASAVSSPAASPAAAPSLVAVPSPSVAAAPANLSKLEMSFTSVSATGIWINVARDQGIFAHNGLDVDASQVANINASVAAVVSGQLAVAAVGGPPALTAAAAGADVVVIAVVTPVWDFELMGPAQYQSVSDLRGKTIGVPSAGSPSELAVLAVLPKYGLTAGQDVTMLYLGAPENRLPALQSGQVAASPVTPPDEITLSAAGFHILDDIAQEQLPGDVQGLVTSRAWLNTHHDQAQGLVDSLVQATALLRRDRTFGVSAIEQYVQYDQATAEDAYDYFYTTDVLTPRLPYPDVEQFTDTQKQLGQTNEAVQSYDVTKLLDRSFVQSAADRGLDKQ